MQTMDKYTFTTAQKIYLPFKRLIGILGSIIGIIVCFTFLWWWVFIINCLVMAKMTKQKPNKVSIIDRVEKESVYKPEPLSEKEKEDNVRNGLTPDGKPMPRPPADLSKLKKPDSVNKESAPKDNSSPKK